MVYVPRITERAMARAAAVDKNDKRCLIENCSQLRGVQLVHMMPRSLSGDADLVSLQSVLPSTFLADLEELST
jgi:hypothetical protein